MLNSWKIILTIKNRKNDSIVSALCTSAWIADAFLACGGRYAAGFCVGGLVEEAFVEVWVDFGGPWPEISSWSSMSLELQPCLKSKIYLASYLFEVSILSAEKISNMKCVVFF